MNREEATAWANGLAFSLEKLIAELLWEGTAGTQIITGNSVCKIWRAVNTNAQYEINLVLRSLDTSVTVSTLDSEYQVLIACQRICLDDDHWFESLRKIVRQQKLLTESSNSSLSVSDMGYAGTQITPL